MIMQMDKWLAYYAALAKEKFPKQMKNRPEPELPEEWDSHFNIYNAVLESGIKIVLEEHSWKNISKMRIW